MLDESSGESAADTGPTDSPHTLELEGDAAFLGPDAGGGVALDGVGDYLEFGSTFAMAAPCLLYTSPSPRD